MEATWVLTTLGPSLTVLNVSLTNFLLAVLLDVPTCWPFTVVFLINSSCIQSVVVSDQFSLNPVQLSDHELQATGPYPVLESNPEASNCSEVLV